MARHVSESLFRRRPKALTWQANTPRTSLRDRFMRKVVVTDDCWLWTGARLPSGYGRIYSGERTEAGNPKTLATHRVSYELFVAPIPEAMTIDHLCRNPQCVNPKHLEVVTMYDNLMRGTSIMAANKRKTHCKRGHRLSGDNLVREGRLRKCRTCRNDGQRRRYRLRTQSEGVKE